MNAFTLGSTRRILALGAHADDLEIGCFGTLKQFASADIEVDCLILSGNKDRIAEQLKSFNEMGISGRKSQLQFEDGLFPTEIPAIKEGIRSFADGITYDLVLVHNREDHHQDHLTLGRVAYNIFRNSIIWEYEIPKYDVDTPQPNVFIPLTETQMQEKVEHLERNFASQASKAWYTPETFRGLARLRGVQCNALFAEAFICRKVIYKI